MEDFLEEDVRCGFVVEESRKKLWECELKMLQIFEEFCEHYHLEYFLIYGALLGAVRHKGFIPWDDDLDIGMLRKDYDIFLQHADEWFKEPYFVQNGCNDKGYFGRITRIRDSRTTGVIWRDRHKKCNNGIFIEIYPVDNISKDDYAYHNQVKRAERLASIMYHYQYPSEIKSTKGKILSKLSKVYVGVLSFEKVFKKFDSICAEHSKEECVFCNTISAVDGLADHSAGDIKHWYIEDVIKTIEVPFENISVKIPINYDRCLKLSYGDYMQLPPVEERGQHHNRIVYYDPSKPYSEALKNGDVDRYFEQL